MLKPFDIYAVKEFELYGSEMPESEDDLHQIKNLEIDIIVSLDPDIKHHPKYETLKKDFDHKEIFITDFATPTKEQVEQFLQTLSKAKEEGKRVLVHCLAGCGRTGIMLALAERFVYGIKDGAEAIANIRKIRPCAVETQEQFEYVEKFER